MKNIAQNRLEAWRDAEPELYAPYELKENLLKIWKPEPEPSAEARSRHGCSGSRNVRDALVAAIAVHRGQMLAFGRYDFLMGFCERLSEIASLNKNRTARSFSAARAALLACGLAREKEKLSKLVGQVAHILEG